MNTRATGASESTVENVDPREVAFYDGLAATWWDTEGPFWPLHRLNRLRSEWLREQLARHHGRDPGTQHPLEGLELLDVGCGGGILSESMARLGASVHGVDVTARNIEVARRHADGRGLDVRYEAIGTRELVARGARYDGVLNMEVVEHVPDVQAFMADCARLVRDGGMMSVATINRTLLSFVTAIVGAEYVLGWLPRGTHRWSRFVTPEEARERLDAGGLDVVAHTGVRVNPLTRRFSLTPSMQVNYMLLATKRARG